MLLKRKILKWKIKFRNKFIDIQYTEVEKNIKILLLKLMNDPNCNILFVPLSDHIYLNNETVKILLHKQKIKIVNHTYYYEISIENRFAIEMMQLIKNKADRDRLKLENQIFLDKNELLQRLIDSLSDSKK